MFVTKNTSLSPPKNAYNFKLSSDNKILNDLAEYHLISLNIPDYFDINETNETKLTFVDSLDNKVINHLLMLSKQSFDIEIRVTDGFNDGDIEKHNLFKCMVNRIHSPELEYGSNDFKRLIVDISFNRRQIHLGK